jgi:hypothetical protein
MRESERKISKFPISGAHREKGNLGGRVTREY